MERFYITTPIYYVNARPHLGHAYTMIAADAMARWRRLAGDDVWFLTGTDEHGDKIAQEAARAGVSPQAYADEISAAFREMWRHLGLTHDDFIRTTEPRHKKVVQAILQRLWDAGELYLGKYGGHYCFGCERFYTEKEIVGGKCPDHQTPLTWIEEENYFFRMSQYQAWLIDYIERHPDFIRPERYRNEILGFLRDPLQDLSISRPKTRLQWGIPLLFDDRFVTYVWFDALINYVSALGYPDDPCFTKYWPHVQHLIGKDILKPHAVYWPCILAALAKADGKPPEALLYRHLNVHGYWTVEGRKMSKSLGNVVEPPAFTAKYGNDAFRYFVMREMTFGLDADFSEAAFIGRLNADLANDLGNLVSRTLTMIERYLDGKIPSFQESAAPADARLREVAEVCAERVSEQMKRFAIQSALDAMWDLVREANQYIDICKPWDLAKQKGQESRKTLETVLSHLRETLRLLGLSLSPFLPETAASLWQQLGISKPVEEARLHTDGMWGGVGVTGKIQKGDPLFPRVEAPTFPERNAPASPAGPEVTVEEFRRLDLKVAEIIAAEALPKSKKLIRIRVKVGEEERTVVAGILPSYRPEDLVGKRVVLLANLASATLMGVESRGMLLAASDPEGRPVLLIPERDVPPGTSIR